MRLGEKIRQRRKAMDYTLEELARKVGTSKQTIFRYETEAITNIPPDKIEALAEALGTTPAYLMGWEGDVPHYAGIFSLRKKKLPLLGEISCGQPIYAEEDRESFVCTECEFDADFCLRAHGDSMIGARIYDGDIVFVKQQETVENGEIAVVIIAEEATLKRVYYYPESSQLILSPENPKYPPLSYHGAELDQIKILGKAVAFQSVVR